MIVPSVDNRSPSRLALDEQIASEPQLLPLETSPNAVAAAVEVHLARQSRRPLAIVGIVENGVVRPVDPAVKLTEHARVIIVTSESV